MKFHTWIVDERDKLAGTPSDPFELAKVGTVLSAPGLSGPPAAQAQGRPGRPAARRRCGPRRRRGARTAAGRDSPCCRRATSWSTGRGAAAGAPWRPSWPSGPAGKAQDEERTVLADARTARPGHALHAAALPLPPPDSAPAFRLGLGLIGRVLPGNAAESSARKRRKGRKGLRQR